ncbi:hypothetical protein [Flavimaricola marinus]|uniref:Uncharacterized protein n=1 Tax=Flavimaricola marinus TaxID=1819565 RepID=A0A238LCW2_9RHOB|nr:hypothetical protein [Flavimaricola marinus]SMY07557.1 hypothetical protein LOM8899_01693 [Flavimaricola marinus]
MNVIETVGMMSTGALVMLGGVYLLDMVRGPETLPGTAAQVAPVAAPAAQPVAAQAAASQAQPVAPAVEVTRAQSDMSGAATIGQLESFVALSMRPVTTDIPLTPEQEEIIAYFKRTARDLNSVSDGYAGEYVAFNDMAINRLEIRHFYTVRQNISDIPVAELLESQTALVQANMCDEPMMRTLIDEHGFRFTYSYLSADNRFLGNVHGNTEACGS